MQIKRKKLGRKPLPEHKRRKKITVRLPQYLIQWLRRQKNQGRVIETALTNYINLL